MPVSVCRAYEQPLVVAVNLHYDLYGRSAVVKHTASSAAAGETEARPSAQRRKDSRLGMTGGHGAGLQHHPGPHFAGPPCRRSAGSVAAAAARDIGLSEFHRAGEAIDRGYEEAMFKLEEVKRLQKALAR